MCTRGLSGPQPQTVCTQNRGLSPIILGLSAGKKFRKQPRRIASGLNSLGIGGLSVTCGTNRNEETQAAVLHAAGH
jgi:hypothetical protein